MVGPMTSWADATDDDGTVYPDVHVWVDDWLAPRYRRSFDTGGRVWCEHWQRHDEAVSRLTALWLAWESLAATEQPGTGMATFWVSYLDPTMAVLLDEAGPFRACTRGHSDRLQPLPTGTDRT